MYLLTDLIESCGFNGKGALKFAVDVATEGYRNKSGGCVDHAFVSGLLLLQTTTYRYWLVKEGAYKPHPRLDYNSKNLTEDVISACASTSLHNWGKSDKTKKTKLKLSENPVLFLSVLLDELQVWHRPPVGEDYIREREDYSLIMEKDIWLSKSDGKVKVNYRDTESMQKVIENSKSRLCSEDLNSIVEFSKCSIPQEMTESEKLDRLLLGEP